MNIRTNALDFINQSAFAGDLQRLRRGLPKIVGIIHDLDAVVVCEGIETPEQHAIALDAGADLLQGYCYARPQADVRLAPARAPLHEVMAA